LQPVEIGRRAGDRGVRVGVGVADVDDGGVVAVDGDGWRGRGRILRHGS
jgi:hypothetical protein